MFYFIFLLIHNKLGTELMEGMCTNHTRERVDNYKRNTQKRKEKNGGNCH